MNPAEFIYSQQQGLLVFLFVQLLISLSNLFGLHRLKRASNLEAAPFVSVLVPARDEEANIGGCVTSLLEQDYENYELLVLDDQSSDGTPDILARLARLAPRLRVLSGQPLPDGWVGKNWACHQLSLVARGDWLLFTDADTRHGRGMLRAIVARAETTRADFLSGMPAQETGSWIETLTVPMLPWMVHAILPVPLVRTCPVDLGAAAIGQFLLFRRRAYEISGGHAAVHDRVVEDFALSRRIKRLGLRWDFIDVSGHVRTRMYTRWRQIWDGLTKNLFAAFRYNLVVFAFVWLWLLVVSWLPLVGLLGVAIGRPLPGFSLVLGVAAYGLDTLIWTISDLRYGLPFWQAFLHPLTIAFFAAVAANAAVHHLLRRPVEWKGRRISTRR